MATAKKLSISNLLSQSWDLFKKEWKYIYLIFLVMFGISFVMQFIISAFEDSGLSIIFVLLNLAVTTAVEMGMLYLFLQLIKGKKKEIMDAVDMITENPGRVATYFLGKLVVGLIVAVGFILLIVPGIIWAIKYMFVPLLLVDEPKLTVGQAMKKSAELTTGHRWTLFGLMLALLALNLVGLIALFVGLLITVPVSTLTTYYAYKQLK